MLFDKTNKHERDERCIFDEKPHVYYVDGQNDNISVTTLIHNHLFPHFDSDKIINNMMKSKNWSNSKYYRMNKQDIKDMWEQNKNESASQGTFLHLCIEHYYNQQIIENNSIEYQYFLKFQNDIGKHLIPYRTEWIVFDEEVKLCGSIDMIFKQTEEDNTNLIIYDWKRTKKINEYSNETGYEPLQHLPNCNFWHYSLQLNIYKRILEKKYDKKIIDMYLLILHPDNQNYIRKKVPVMTDEIDYIWEFRKIMLANK